jgi:hypothetical protein
MHRLHSNWWPYRYTTAQVSYAKLSMFEPRMQLADDLRYAIKNMACCEFNDEDTEEYIHGFIFGHFGFTYIISILLGGIAQHNIFIDRQKHEQLVNQGINTKHQAQISFQLNFDANVGSSP